MRPATALAAAAALAVAGAAQAQDPHAGHQPPPAAPAAPADPHAGHRAPAAQAAPLAGHASPPAATEPAGPQAGPPPIPADFDADRFFPKAEMDAARDRLAKEHGRIAWSKATFEKLEFRPGSPDGYAWEGRASFGGDIDRLVVKSRGEGDRRLERAETEVLWGRAISPWFDLEAGVRQDLQRKGLTYAVLGLDGLAPYQFDLDAALFLSSRGDMSARIEAAHDYRLTQRLILEPRAEANFAAGAAPSQGTGSGLTRVELGLRLRYAVAPEFSPYVGVEHERAFGRTARLARAAGEAPRDTRFVVGIRAWF